MFSANLGLKGSANYNRSHNTNQHSGYNRNDNYNVPSGHYNVAFMNNHEPDNWRFENRAFPNIADATSFYNERLTKPQFLGSVALIRNGRILQSFANEPKVWKNALRDYKQIPRKSTTTRGRK